MSPEDVVENLGVEHIPQGLGPIPPSWQPRLKRAGTFDVIWEKTRWPGLPSDFTFDFYNSAHPDLIYDGFVDGDEKIELVNLTPEGYLSVYLPGYELGSLVRYEDGELLPLPIFLDTIHLDIEKRKTYLTWRGIYSVEKPIRVLETRMRLKETSALSPEALLSENSIAGIERFAVDMDERETMMMPRDKLQNSASHIESPFPKDMSEDANKERTTLLMPKAKIPNSEEDK